MDDIAVGRVLREARLRLRVSQVALAARAGVAQSVVSRIERGHLDEVTLVRIRRVAAVLEVRLPFAPSWRGGDLARLLDRRHAGLVEQLVALLGELGWETAVEATFNEFGERGSIDVLAWHEESRALLVVEVKSRLVDLQDLLAGLDRKARLAPVIARKSHAWDPAVVARLLVLPAGSTSADALARHRAVFRTALPDRTVGVKRWLRSPLGPLRGVLLLRDIGPATGPRRTRH